jgi:Protein of unknown function (DUF3761)
MMGLHQSRPQENTLTRSPRQIVCLLALVLTLFSQLLISQTPSPADSNASSAAIRKTKTDQNKATCTPNGSYVNSKGETVPRPENCSGPPAGATAQCRDGSYSFSRSRRGTCSHHGGVARWL